jgi:SAM-dependent methyltransferase
MNNRPSASDLWAAEHAEGGIPSSTRTSPSGAVVWAVEELKRRNVPLRTAVDAGCGKGRNSLYLASLGLQVTAMDFTPNAVHALEREARARGLAGKVRAIIHDVTEPWPVGRRDIDLVIDTFCFKHITPHELRLEYKAHLLDVLGARGHYLMSFASIGDGYYGRYVTTVDESGAATIIDPANNIPSVLFERSHVLKFFAPELSWLAEIRNNKPSAMHGQVYERETYALLLGRSARHFVG